MSGRLDPETLVDLTRDTVVVLDADGVYRYCNATVVDLLGFDPEELIGADAFELVYPEDRERVRDAFDAIVAGERGTDEPLEYRCLTAASDWIWLRTMIHTPAETGIDGYVLTSRDVTEEVESRRRLETIASVSADVFWMFAADWSELLFVNDAVEDVYGVSVETLERRPQSFLDAVHPDDRPYVERAMNQLSNGESTRVDYRIGSEEGPTTWVRVPGKPVIERGDVVAVTGFARDVTEEYRRERQLAVMDNLLRHTIRNDMNIVDGSAAQIAERVADASGDDDDTGETLPVGFADAVTEHVETIRRVADDLLTTAEKQRGVIEMLNQRRSPRPIALEPAVEAAVEMVDDDLDGPVVIDGDADHAASGVTETNEPAPRLFVSCQSDATAFTHPEVDYAIAELVANAVEHTESMPAVRIEVSATADTVDVTVWDNCEPIPPEERSAVTDRWEMDDINHTNGMGLWLVYWVADRSGGDIAFDTYDDGNVVTLSLPNADCDDVEHAASPSGDSDGPEARKLGAVPND